MRLLAVGTVAIFLATAGVATASPKPKPCDPKCLEARVTQLEAKVFGGVELASEEEGYVNEGEEEKTTGVEGGTGSWTFECPEGWVALETFPIYNGTPDFFGGELFSEGRSFQALVGGGSPGHPVVMKARGVCIRGRYVDFGE